MDRDKSLDFHPTLLAASSSSSFYYFLFHFTSKIILCYNVVCISELIAIIEWRSSPRTFSYETLFRDDFNFLSFCCCERGRWWCAYYTYPSPAAAVFLSCRQHPIILIRGAFSKMLPCMYVCIYAFVCIRRRSSSSVCLFKTNTHRVLEYVVSRWNEEDGSHFRHEFTLNAL